MCTCVLSLAYRLVVGHTRGAPGLPELKLRHGCAIRFCAVYGSQGYMRPVSERLPILWSNLASCAIKYVIQKDLFIVPAESVESSPDRQADPPRHATAPTTRLLPEPYIILTSSSTLCLVEHQTVAMPRADMDPGSMALTSDYSSSSLHRFQAGTKHSMVRDVCLTATIVCPTPASCSCRSRAV